MDRDTAVQRAQMQLGFRADLVPRIISALQDTQQDLENAAELPWFLIKDDQTLTTANGVPTVSLPSDFLRENEEDSLWYYDTTGDTPAYRQMEKTSMTQLQLLRPGGGPPKSYHLRNVDIYLGPTPDDIYTLRWSYYGRDELLDVNRENQWLKHVPSLMIGRSAMRLAGPLGLNQSALTTIAQMIQDGEQRLAAFMVARGDFNQRYVIGGSD